MRLMWVVSSTNISWADNRRLISYASMAASSAKSRSENDSDPMVALFIARCVECSGIQSILMWNESCAIIHHWRTPDLIQKLLLVPTSILTQLDVLLHNASIIDTTFCDSHKAENSNYLVEGGLLVSVRCIKRSLIRWYSFSFSSMLSANIRSIVDLSGVKPLWYWRRFECTTSLMQPRRTWQVLSHMRRKEWCLWSLRNTSLRLFLYIELR